MAKAVNKKKSIEEYRKTVTEILDQELGRYGDDELRDRIRRKLDDSAFDIVTGALGFDRSWGRWEVSRRDNKNLVVEAMLSKSRLAVEEWLAEQAGKLPTLPKQAIQALHKEYLDRLRENIARELRNRAAVDAHEFVDRILAEAETETEAAPSHGATVGQRT